MGSVNIASFQSIDIDNFLTLKQVADLLNVTWQTVRNYIKNGELEAIKLSDGRDYRINPVDLHRFIEKKYINKSDRINEGIFELMLNNKNTKNCVLYYKNKLNEKEIIDSIKRVEIIPVKKRHSLEGYLNSVFCGDNVYILKELLTFYKSKVDLVYIDPPFGTNQDFILYDGKTGYSDKITNTEFLEFLRVRLILLRELLSPQGSIYVHIDKKMSYYVKIILDEVFGEKNYINEIIRIKCNPKNFARKAYGNFTDTIFYYAKERDNQIWNDITVPLTKYEIETLFPKVDSNGRRYTTHPLHAPGETKDGPTGGMWQGMYPPEGRHWRYTPDVLDELLKNNLIEWSATGNPRKIIYAKDHKGKKPQDIWEYKDRGKKYSSFPTEKNSEMLEFIIKNSSNKDSIVLDCFAGSFSTLVQAGKLGRKFIGIDCLENAVNIGMKNLNKAGISYNYFTIKE